MSIRVNDSTKANFKAFVELSDKAYSPAGKGENTVVRLSGAPKGMPVKFSWTATIDVDGNVVSTPMRIDAGNVAI